MQGIIIWVERGPHDSAAGALLIQGNLHLPDGRVCTSSYVHYPTGRVDKSDGTVIDGDSNNIWCKKVCEDAIRKLASGV